MQRKKLNTITLFVFQKAWILNVSGALQRETVLALALVHSSLNVLAVFALIRCPCPFFFFSCSLQFLGLWIMRIFNSENAEAPQGQEFPTHCPGGAAFSFLVLPLFASSHSDQGSSWQTGFFSKCPGRYRSSPGWRKLWRIPPNSYCLGLRGQIFSKARKENVC